MALNHIDLMGRLVADPELRTIGEDTHVASFRIAVERDRQNKETGERDADFINVTAWRGAADFLCQYFSRGDMIVVSGRLQTRTYDDKDGNKRTATDVVAENIYFGSAKREGGQSTGSTSADEDLPF